MDIITRDDAYRKGARRYYTGRPCRRGHLSERFVSNGCCCMCVNWKTTPVTDRANTSMPPSGYPFPMDAKVTPELVSYVHARVIPTIAGYTAEYEALAPARQSKKGEEPHHVTKALYDTQLARRAAHVEALLARGWTQEAIDEACRYV